MVFLFMCNVISSLAIVSRLYTGTPAVMSWVSQSLFVVWGHVADLFSDQPFFHFLLTNGRRQMVSHSCNTSNFALIQFPL